MVGRFTKQLKHDLLKWRGGFHGLGYGLLIAYIAVEGSAHCLVVLVSHGGPHVNLMVGGGLNGDSARLEVSLLFG